MARYSCVFKICLYNARGETTAEQAEEVIVDCPPDQLVKEIGSAKHALEATVRAALDRIDPTGSSRISLKQTECLSGGN